MSTRSSNKNLIFLVTVLLLTNIAVLAYFLWFKKNEPRNPGERRAGIMIETLQKEVGFNETQMAEYKALKELQKETVRPLFEEMRKAKETLFLLMGDSTASDSTVQAAADVIAKQQKSLDLHTLQHFKKVRSLCTPEQQIKYDSAIVKMFRKMGKPHKQGESDKEKNK